MVGLYETALDELSVIKRDGKIVYPKIVASTATVRRAETQVRTVSGTRSAFLQGQSEVQPR